MRHDIFWDQHRRSTDLRTNKHNFPYSHTKCLYFLQPCSYFTLIHSLILTEVLQFLHFKHLIPDSINSYSKQPCK